MLKIYLRNTQIKTHIIDTAIKLACSNYKSAITSYKRGLIKYFRIRYWRHKRPSKILEIEKWYFKNNTLCKIVFGTLKFQLNGRDYNVNNINSSVKLRYNGDKYTLYVPVEKEVNKIKNRETVVSFDPGIRTMLTGIGNECSIEIETNVGHKIGKYLKRLDKK